MSSHPTPQKEAAHTRRRNWLIACDESGTKGTPYYGFGALAMPWERRGDFTGLIGGLRTEHNFATELKWKRVNARSESFCRAVVENFFSTRWLAFHCIIIRKSLIDKSLHSGDYDLAWRRHFSMFLSRKLVLPGQVLLTRTEKYDLRVM
jgi:hypothetical protein